VSSGGGGISPPPPAPTTYTYTVKVLNDDDPTQIVNEPIFCAGVQIGVGTATAQGVVGAVYDITSSALPLVGAGPGFSGGSITVTGGGEFDMVVNPIWPDPDSPALPIGTYGGQPVYNTGGPGELGTNPVPRGINVTADTVRKHFGLPAGTTITWWYLQQYYVDVGENVYGGTD